MTVPHHGQAFGVDGEGAGPAVAGHVLGVDPQRRVVVRSVDGRDDVHAIDPVATKHVAPQDAGRDERDVDASAERATDARIRLDELDHVLDRGCAEEVVHGQTPAADADDDHTDQTDHGRLGVEQPGPDVGAWTSVRLAGDRVSVAYQDRDRAALRYAIEGADGVFHAHDVDDEADAGGDVGLYASLAIGDVPSIAYVATNVETTGGRVDELRLATASMSNPGATTDWTTITIASADAAVTTSARELPSNVGLFVDLLALADGRRVLVHYDASERALLAHVETAKGSGTFTATTLDGGGGLDRGRWVSAVADADTIHLAYQDSIGHRVLYRTFTPGGAPSAIEVVDDGTRAGDRPHWVGAGITLSLDGATVRLAYQDAATANVVVATRETGWTRTDATSGPALDGFHLALPRRGAGPLAWDQISPAVAGSHRLILATP